MNVGDLMVKIDVNSEQLNQELNQARLRLAIDRACYDAFTGRLRDAFVLHSTHGSTTYSWSHYMPTFSEMSGKRKEKKVKAVYQVWVVQDDEILVDGMSVIATNETKAKLRVLYKLKEIDIDAVEMYTKKVFTLQCCE